ncbi:MAG: septum formation protein Maf [Candidatus Brocadiae bacterium]|nr:septum formation protein Maf [Candidatus Brocadiia bacterium]
MKMKNKDYRLILASQSPRRKDLLSKAGFTFEIHLPDCDETCPFSDPTDYSTWVALKKGRNVSSRLLKSNSFSQEELDKTLVLSADTIVVLGEKIFGKPQDFDDAYRMLWSLSRNPHYVMTAVCLMPLAWVDECFLETEITQITMRPLSHEEITNYIQSGEAYGKAGAYAIQETADQFVESIDGNFDNVVGLPVGLVKDMIEQWQNGNRPIRPVVKL